MEECKLTGEHCPYDERVCRAMHLAIDSRLGGISWIFGILITLNIAFFSFMGWTAARVSNMDVEQARYVEKVTKIEDNQNRVMTKLDLISTKLTDLATESVKRDSDLSALIKKNP
jgi:hypothetical protein